MQETKVTFDSITQRVVNSYARALAGGPEGADEAQRDLHIFFKALYAALYAGPARFGLPEPADDCIDGTEENRTKKLAEMNRKMQKPREQIQAGLDFLMQFGQQGIVGADPATGAPVLLLDGAEYQALLKNTKIKKPFLSGLAEVGVEVAAGGEPGAGAVMRSPRFPAMLPALKNLAAACARAAEANVGKFNFARCDFQALDEHYTPSALELYRIFTPEQYQRAAQLHAYFTGQNYKPIVRIQDMHTWLVQYQGKRQIKVDAAVSDRVFRALSRAAAGADQVRQQQPHCSTHRAAAALLAG